MQIKEKWFSSFHYFFFGVATSKAITSDFSSATDSSTGPKKWVLPRHQYWFENLLNSNALNMWWKENFWITRETFHFICTAVAPVI